MNPSSSFNPESVYLELIDGIQKFFEKTNAKKAVIGLSGGIDSTLTLKLCVDALGPDKISGLIMPEAGLTAPENILHAKKLAEFFEIESHYQPINQFLMDFRVLSWKPNELAQMNTKARIRMCLLYNYANTKNGIVMGTSNKSELMLGYGTKFGDLACDFEPLGEIFKTEVYLLGKHLELPDEILNKRPSAELAPGQTDEDDLGASYKELDKILKIYEKGPEYAIEEGFDSTFIYKTRRMVEKNEHKRNLPPIIKLKKS